MKVGIVLDKGGKDDKSFNSAAVRGAQSAEKKLPITVKIIEMSDDNAGESLLRKLAKDKYDLIVAIGFSQAESVKKVATFSKDRNFLIVDGEVPLPNVQSAMFQEHEGSFLIGAIAALKSKTGKIGFIGGMDIPLIRRFEMGYEAGAKHINPNIKLVSNFVGITGEAWINPPKAKELAVSQYSSGADIIFSAAGASNGGVFDAAEEKEKLAIGVDSNQNWVKPGFILTSMLKRVDVAVERACEEVVKGKFKGGVIRYGLHDQGIDFAIDEYNKKLVTPDMLKRINGIKADIIAGKIKVPDYYEKKSKK